MKALRIFAVTLVIVAILTVSGWFLRNTIIRRISSPLLARYDVELVDVSLDTLATRDAHISHLELLHDKGTTIVVEGLTLPIGRPKNASKTYIADSVSIITTNRDEGAPLEMARLINQFLTLTDTLPGTELVIKKLSLEPYPEVREFDWLISDVEQTIRGTVESVAVSAKTSRIDPSTYHVGFTQLPQPGAGRVPDFVSGELRQSDRGVLIVGAATLDLPGWQTVMSLLGLVPDTIELQSGSAALRYELDIPYDTTQSPSMAATLMPTSSWQLRYVGAAGDSTDVLVGESGAVEILATFPDITWSLQQRNSSLLVDYEDWHDIPVSVDDLSCQTGPACSMRTSVSMSAASLPIGNIEKFELSSALNVTFPDDAVRVDVLPGASIELTGFSTSSMNVSLIEAGLVSDATLELSNAGWVLGADSVDGRFDALSAGKGISVTSPLYLEKIFLSDLDEVMSAGLAIYAPSLQTAVKQGSMSLPGLKGEISLQAADVTLNLTTIGLQREGHVKAHHNLDTGVGGISIADATVSFSARNLAKRLKPWRHDWDFVAGEVAIDGQANWAHPDPESITNGQLRVNVAELSGYYADTVFTGLSTSVAAAYDSATGLTAEPSNITVGLLDMGLPIENVTANYVLDPKLRAVDVTGLQMTGFGGVIWADPFSFHTESAGNNLVVHGESLEISEILDLKEFATVEVSGSIAAVLPVAIAKDGISVTGGTLTGEAPGGVIRYSSGTAPDKADTSSIGLVKQALSHFRYESLTSEVNYDPAGDLKLKMKLTGRNPDMEGNRPVVLNLSVENNVPQMLKSLQAARAVEEVLEKRLAE